MGSQLLSRRVATPFVVGLATCAALGVAAQGRSSAPPLAKAASTAPSDAEARGLLRARFALARQAGVTGYCADVGYVSNCAEQWQRAGGAAAVPRALPRVTRSWTSMAYRTLHVCGVDGRGAPYASDFVVENAGGRVRPLLAVFWSGQTYSGAFWSGTEPTRAPRPPDPRDHC